MKNKKDLISEIATRARSFDHWATGYHLPNPDPILKKMGKDIAVYRELLSDGQVRSGVRRRKAAIKGLEWRITTTNNEKVDEQLYQVFNRLPLNNIITEMLNASLFGYQVSEVIWAERDGLIVPAEIIGKKPEWFVFDEDNQLRFRTKEHWIDGELLPEHKFLLTTQEATQDNPYGLGDLSLCFWAATFKKGGFKYWLEFTEKYGSPWLIGKHPRTTSEPEKDRLADSLEAMIGTAIAVIPDDASVDIVESAGKGASSDSYEKFLAFCKGEINIALLGQNQTTEQESNRASATAGLEVIEDIRNDDKAMLEATFNTLLQWICHYNFNVEQLPTFEFFEQESINTEQVERDEKLHRMGVRFTKQYFMREYGFEDGDIELQAVNSTVNFAEHHHHETEMDRIVSQMGELSQHSLNANIAQVRARLDTAESLEEAQQILDDILPQLDFSEYAQLFAEGLTTATLRGRYEVKQEAKR
ncbi:DUF935 family protein [Glaesserella parasuis]|uniref:DUF935 domain-containing protein n=2 Tax=Glaesserella parasuis TaxID=738 RepID=UPI001366638E|nr:DUF935 family protein [Glaesserella parasuis]MDG6455003.1 DUF935 family protein [Glaesserella parasuis]MDO9644857.1 DUF935 family protein [Glaesserella parasuis]MDO9660704.1 DUF935 family protein [Glaesserella parasuis]MDO9663517.1 DUF935 family protein [Glaesserella parasuis]MDO9678871.1 DUF935 family protein [Glaesserella parasuis]